MARLQDLFLVAAVVVASSSLATAATLTVDLNGGADYTDIQVAIDAARDGDTVIVKPGEYVIREPINFNRLHEPANPASPPVKNIIVKSEGGAEVTKMRMAETPTNPHRASVVIFENGEGVGSKLDGFTLTEGKGTGDPSNGIDPRGGGVYCLNSSPTLINCTITENSSVSLCSFPQTIRICGIGGGAYWDFSSPVLINCTISENSAGEYGGGVYCHNGCSPILTNCTISGNSARYDGGGMYSCCNSSPTLSNCIVWNNLGGSLFKDDISQPIITYSCIEEDLVWPGEGNINQDPLFCSPGIWESDKLLGGNYRLQPYSPCIGSGEVGVNMGADLGTCQILRVSQNGTGDFTDIQSAIDAAADGDTVLVKPGEYVIAEPITFKGKAITVKSEGGAQATMIRGGIGFNNGETKVTALEGFTVTGSSDCGVYCSNGSSPTLTGCTISGNYDGGLLCSNSSPTLTGCTISGNSAGTDNGGGVYCWNNSSPTLTSCTISGNSAQYGGGLYCHSSYPSLTNCTISGNSALEGGGVYCSSTPTLTNCILWNNPGGSLVAKEGGAPQVSFSCVQAEAVWPGEGNIDADPLFCGWDGPRDMYVDAAAPPGGDGSPERPFAAISPALAYSLSLRADSPCIGLGKDGEDMGAAQGACQGGGELERTVHLAAGRYGMGGLTLAQGASIASASREETVLEGTVKGLRTGARLSRVTVTAAKDDYGSYGIVVSSGESPVIEDCAISGNMGTGVYCSNGSSPTLTGCTISGNSGGGVDCSDYSSPTLTDCTISGNSAYEGGGVYCFSNSSPTLTNCTISGNSGGGLSCEGESSPTLTNCILWDNVGGSWAVEGNSTPMVSFSCLETEELWPGAGNINADPIFCGGWERQEVWVDPSWAAPGDGGEGNPFSDPRQATSGYSSSLALSSSSPCWGTGKGGSDMGSDNGRCDEAWAKSRVVHLAAGTYKAEDLELVHRVSLLGAGEDKTVIEGTVGGLRTGSSLSNLTITNGTAGGVVITSGEGPEITNCTISGNSAGNGGGVYCWNNSSPTLTSCTISGNSASGYYFSGGGGGVYCGEGSTTTLTDCTISGNSASNYYFSGIGGGGVYCVDNSPTLANCTISGNLAENGGGVWGSPTLTNCTISGNWGRWGGGVYGFPNMTNCTISGNSAYSDGGGVYCLEGSSPNLTNCIVWGNNPESVCGNLFHCLTDQDPLFVRSGEWVDCGSPDDPLCIAYQWNPDTGEPTAWHRWVFDYHLQPGSPAIDAGTSEGAPIIDIEGHGRPCGAGVDIGAYEFGGCPGPQPFIRGDSNADGRTDISDGVAILNYLFLGGTNVTCEQAGDVNDDGLLDISDGIYVLNFLFTGGKAIEPPVGTCGVDPTGHDLPCAEFPICE